MADRGIIFSAPMVRALLAGTKTQTRRLANFVQPDGDGWHINGGGGGMIGADDDAVLHHGRHYAPYAPGDRLYVREAWRVSSAQDHLSGSKLPWPLTVEYPADGQGYFDGRYRHARFMPRWASRLWLSVTEVRVQRLQDISEADAIAEGIDEAAIKHFGCPIKAYAALWNHLHGAENDTSWEANPWVVAVSFDVNRGNIDKVRAHA